MATPTGQKIKDGISYGSDWVVAGLGAFVGFFLPSYFTWDYDKRTGEPTHGWFSFTGLFSAMIGVTTSLIGATVAVNAWRSWGKDAVADIPSDLKDLITSEPEKPVTKADASGIRHDGIVGGQEQAVAELGELAPQAPKAVLAQAKTPAPDIASA